MISIAIEISMAGGAGVGGWTPVDLSGLVMTLLPAMSRAQGKLWQNAAKTTPATADGDPVRVATCPFTGVDFTTTDDSSRPLLRDEGGGKWSLAFDGIDDGFGFPNITTAGAFEDWFAGTITTKDQALAGNFTDTAFQLRINFTANCLTLVDGSVALTSSVLPITTPARMSVGFSRSGGTAAFYQGNTTVSTTASAGTFTLNRFGTFTSAANATNSRFVGAVFTTQAQSVANRAALVSYLGAL